MSQYVCKFGEDGFYVLEEFGKHDTPEKAERTKMVVQKLQQRKRPMEERPDAELDGKTPTLIPWVPKRPANSARPPIFRRRRAMSWDGVQVSITPSHLQ